MSENEISLIVENIRVASNLDTINLGHRYLHFEDFKHIFKVNSLEKDNNFCFHYSVDSLESAAIILSRLIDFNDEKILNYLKSRANIINVEKLYLHYLISPAQRSL